MNNRGVGKYRMSLGVLSGSLTVLWAVIWLASTFKLVDRSAAGPFGLLTLFAFAWVHGAARYGWKAMIAFIAIVIVVATIFENLSVATGFPFGAYVHHMEPKLLYFPIFGMISYPAMAYLGWSCATLLIGDGDRSRSPLGYLPAVVAAAFVVTGYDASVDPIFATLLGAWTYNHGGGYFGVPLSNCLGWLLTSGIFYSAFAVWLSRDPSLPRGGQGAFWRAQPALLLLLSGLSQPLMLLGAKNVTVMDQAGASWRSHDLLVTTATMSVCTMLFVGVTGVLLAFGRRDDAVSP